MAVDQNAINSLVQGISEQQRNSLYRLLRDHDSRVALRSRLVQQIHADSRRIAERFLSPRSSTASSSAGLRGSAPEPTPRSVSWSPNMVNIVGNSSSSMGGSRIIDIATADIDTSIGPSTEAAPAPPPPPPPVSFPPPPPLPSPPPPGDVGASPSTLTVPKVKAAPKRMPKAKTSNAVNSRAPSRSRSPRDFDSGSDLE